MRSLVAPSAAVLVLLTAGPALAEPLPVGSPPVAVDDAVDVQQNVGVVDRLVDALANDTDPDGDPLGYTAVGPAGKGDAHLQDGRLFYRPHLESRGTDSFTYTVTDGRGNTATGTVTVTLWVQLPAPTGFTHTAVVGSSTLGWAAVAGAAEYRVYQGTAPVHRTTGLTWTHSGIPDDARHRYRVVAVDGAGREGAFSHDQWRSPRPLPPTGLTVGRTRDATSLRVTWDGGDSWSTPGPWRLYRDGVPIWTSSWDAGRPVPEFLDTGLVPGRQYSYQVSRVGELESVLSAAVRATPVALSPLGLFAWDHLGELGAVTVPERVVPGGRRQDHATGVVLQQDGEAPHLVAHGIASAYLAAGGPAGGLGFPVGDRECGLRDFRCVQFFEGGSAWTSVSGVRVVPADIEVGWAATDWEEGPLGYPTSGLIPLRGGSGQVFEGGAVYWSPAGGSHAVWGAIRDSWGRHGWEAGVLGYPTSDVIALRGGSGQVFQGGAVYWSEATGAHAVGGAIRATWGRAGWENGVLGYPTSDPVPLRGGGVGQRFQGGAVYWTPSTGAHVVRGWLGDTWAAWGYEAGVLGYPVMNEVCGLRGGGCGQVFQGGSIYLTAGTGSHVIGGAIRDRWAAQGYENGLLGYPTTDHICGLRNGGCGQVFQGGRIYWTPATGAHPVRGSVFSAWAAQGWEAGRLGYPVASEYPTRGLILQDFQGGRIVFDPRTGRTSISHVR